MKTFKSNISQEELSVKRQSSQLLSSLEACEPIHLDIMPTSIFTAKGGRI